MESRRHLSERRGVARRQGQARRRAAAARGSSRASSASSAATLADALDRRLALDKELSRLYVYASMLADQDTRDSRPRACSRRWCSWRRPLGAESVVHRARRSCSAGKATHRQIPRGRTAAEVLSLLPRRHRAPRAAHAVATAKRRSSPTPARWRASPSNIYNILTNADFPYPTVTLSDGTDGQARSGRRSATCARCPTAPIARR